MEWIIPVLLIIIIVFQFITFFGKKDVNKKELEKLFLLVSQSFDRLDKSLKEDFRHNREESRLSSLENRKELKQAIAEFKQTFEKEIAFLNQLQREKFAAMDENQRLLVDKTEKRLEEIRLTVDEKLQKTLNERIGQSFRLVTE